MHRLPTVICFLVQMKMKFDRRMCDTTCMIRIISIILFPENKLHCVITYLLRILRYKAHTTHTNGSIIIIHIFRRCFKLNILIEVKNDLLLFSHSTFIYLFYLACQIDQILFFGYISANLIRFY